MEGKEHVFNRLSEDVKRITGSTMSHRTIPQSIQHDSSTWLLIVSVGVFIWLFNR